MILNELMIKHLNKVCDFIYAKIPQQSPSFEKLKECKIISHRGQHDNISILENTLIAFDNAENNKGIWGIEFDFRWTKDIQPVVIHDSDLSRLFDSNIKISDIKLSELKKLFPQIPSLQEVVQKYGGKLHLMVEAKEKHNTNHKKKEQILEEIFKNLIPKKDFHFLGLSADILDSINFIEDKSKIIVAIFNEKSLSEIAITKKYAGIGGHYLLINSSIVRKHLGFGQKIGVGYPISKNSIFREINRGIEWIFCNDAEKLCKIIKTELNKKNIIF